MSERLQPPSLEQLQAELSKATEAAASILPVLPRLAGPEWSTLVEGFRPRPEDFARVFLEPEPFVALYQTVWAQIPRSSGVKPEQSQIRAVAATTALLRFPNAASDAFPGGYRRIVNLLAEGQVWLAWKYVRPGNTAGTAFDGLTLLGDRWVWFPHPWRAIQIRG
jgi:hypothetical protein